MHHNLYTDSHAEANKANAGMPYRPANGHEGVMFECSWCHKCQIENKCEIFRASIRFDEDDPQYPKELIIGVDGQPECTAFIAKG